MNIGESALSGFAAGNAILPGLGGLIGGVGGALIQGIGEIFNADDADEYQKYVNTTGRIKEG